jgi:hypothetical protein
LIADQVSTRILVAYTGIAGETNPIIKFYWNNFGELWILGDIIITCLALGVTVLIMSVDKKNIGLRLSQYSLLFFIFISAITKIVVSINNIQYLIGLISYL